MISNRAVTNLLVAFAAASPGLAAAQATGGSGMSFFLAQRLWFASWDLPVADSRIVAGGGAAAPVLQDSVTNVGMRKTLPVTTLGVRVGPWTASASLSPWTRFKDDRLVTDSARRYEYDLNVGYAVTPNIGVAAIYKSGRSESGVMRDSLYVDRSILSNKQKLRGLLFGVSGNSVIGENLVMYGNLAYGPGKSSLTSEPTPLDIKFDFRYTVSEVGFSYRIPSIAFGNLALQAGYRIQVVTYTNVDLFTLEPVTGTVLSSRTVRTQSTTQGPFVAFSVAF